MTDATRSPEERISILEQQAGFAIPTRRTNTKDIIGDNFQRILALERKNDLDQIEANLIFSALDKKQKGTEVERRICALEGKPANPLKRSSSPVWQSDLEKLEDKLVALEKTRNLPRPEEALTELSFYRRVILLEAKEVGVTERIRRLTEFNTYNSGRLVYLTQCLRDLELPPTWRPPPRESLSLVEASFLFENSTSERAFAALKEQFDENLWQRGVQITTPTKATRFVYVVTPSTPRLEIGQNLAEGRIKDALSSDESRMFILTVHSGKTADPIHFSSPYGDRIQVGQIVFSERTPGSPTLVSDARGVPLGECMDKLVSFLKLGGTVQETEWVNTSSGSSESSCGSDPLVAGVPKSTPPDAP